MLVPPVARTTVNWLLAWSIFVTSKCSFPASIENGTEKPFCTRFAIDAALRVSTVPVESMLVMAPFQSSEPHVGV